MGAVQGKRTVFSTRLCIGGQQWPTQNQQAFSKQNPETAMLSAPFGCTHPPPPIPPFLLKQNLSPKVIAGSDVTRWKFYARYIWLHPERVKLYLTCVNFAVYTWRHVHPHQLCWLCALLVLAICIISNHGNDVKLSRSHIADWVADIAVVIRILAKLVSCTPACECLWSGALTYSRAHVWLPL